MFKILNSTNLNTTCTCARDIHSIKISDVSLPLTIKCFDLSKFYC